MHFQLQCESVFLSPWLRAAALAVNVSDGGTGGGRLTARWVWAVAGRHCVRVVALLDWPLLRQGVTAFVSPVPVVRVAGGGWLGGGSGWQRRLGMVADWLDSLLRLCLSAVSP